MKYTPVTIISVFLLLFFACRWENNSFSMSAESLLAELHNDAYLQDPAELPNSGTDIQLVDIRSNAEYQADHLPGAINIPAQDLLDPAGRKVLSDRTTTFVLYGWNQLQANGPWMLLRQLDYQNIKVLQGGYAYFQSEDADAGFLVEEARYPYDSLFQLAIQRTKMEEEALLAKPALVKDGPVAKKEIVPKKKKVEKEEEEGC